MLGDILAVPGARQSRRLAEKGNAVEGVRFHKGSSHVLTRKRRRRKMVCKRCDNGYCTKHGIGLDGRRISPLARGGPDESDKKLLSLSSSSRRVRRAGPKKRPRLRPSHNQRM